MADREERRFAEVPRDAVKLMAETVGLELGDEVAALLAEDVCYRLREMVQTSAQFLKHTPRRRLSTEDFNRALRWANVEPVCGHGAVDPTSFRPVRDGELLVPEEREVNLVELALATSIPKGGSETIVRVQVSYLDGKGNEEAQGGVPAGVSTLSDDLMRYYQQVTRAVLGDDRQLMKVALQDLQSNSKIAALLPYFVYVVSGAVESVLYPQLATYWPNLQTVLDDTSVSNAQVKADGHKVYGAILVAVEKLLKTRACLEGPADVGVLDPCSPAGSPPRDVPAEGLGIGSHLLQGGPGVPFDGPPLPPLPLPRLYRHLYSFFGDSLTLRLGTPAGPPPSAPPAVKAPPLGPSPPSEQGRKMPQLTLSLAPSPRREGSPAADAPGPRAPLPRPSLAPKPVAARPSQRLGSLGVREAFQRPRMAGRGGHPSFLIEGRQTGRRVRGRLFRTSFPVYRGPTMASRYGQHLPMIGRVNKPVRKWLRAHYSLAMLL
ncbi:TAF6-like RNA polymerase II p300/CBP-associated factor-associated factor 65 kDa subunit 6L isoform X4 [Narcine bancroftii]|uniref:TAF6-like RNA polymerase II p300/CBP-associated factor-associated factor 65 kDa subunit 6L isoform X4 n=1 Tax=Narcine bancroftii TaxID=1343680 RepID=UPI003831EB91